MPTETNFSALFHSDKNTPFGFHAQVWWFLLEMNPGRTQCLMSSESPNRQIISRKYKEPHTAESFLST